MTAPLSGSSFPAPAMLRLSVTDRCNFRCRYCMPDGVRGKLAASDLPALEELAAAAAWLARLLPIRKVKLTGGEPLVRRGIAGLVRALAEFPGVEDLSMTSNGAQLAAHARALREAGLRRVNISLDTLDPDRFRDLTGGRLQDTLEGIAAALDAGLRPVKLNAILRRSTWRLDLLALLDYACLYSLEIRFIELMPTGQASAWVEQEYISAARVQAWLSERTESERLSDAGPARRCRLRWSGGDVTVGWITPRSQTFCAGCDRLRLDARGGLRRCLMDAAAFPLINRLREGQRDSLREEVLDYLRAKQPPADMSTEEAMIAVGG